MEQKGAALGGITSIFEMPNTNPSTTILKSIKSKIINCQRKCLL